MVAARATEVPQTTAALARLITETVGAPTDWRLHPTRSRWTLHPAARTFQALRILVNRELANLEQLLRVLPSCLRPGGRAAIISFHSGEDRLVKAAFRDGLQPAVIGPWATSRSGPVRTSGWPTRGRLGQTPLGGRLVLRTKRRFSRSSGTPAGPMP